MTDFEYVRMPTQYPAWTKSPLLNDSQRAIVWTIACHLCPLDEQGCTDPVVRVSGEILPLFAYNALAKFGKQETAYFHI